MINKEMKCPECNRDSSFYGLIREWLDRYEGLEWGYKYPEKMKLINTHFRKVLKDSEPKNLKSKKG